MQRRSGGNGAAAGRKEDQRGAVYAHLRLAGWYGRAGARGGQCACCSPPSSPRPTPPLTNQACTLTHRSRNSLPTLRMTRLSTRSSRRWDTTSARGSLMTFLRAPTSAAARTFRRQSRSFPRLVCGHPVNTHSLSQNTKYPLPSLIKHTPPLHLSRSASRCF